MSLPTDTLIFDAHGRGVDLDAIVTALEAATTAIGRPPVGGRLLSDGTTFSGTGFTPAHVEDSGVYTITFAVPFDEAPSIVATSSSGIDEQRIYASSTPEAATVGIRDGSGDPIDKAFNFIAFGS